MLTKIKRKIINEWKETFSEEKFNSRYLKNLVKDLSNTINVLPIDQRMEVLKSIENEVIRFTDIEFKTHVEQSDKIKNVIQNYYDQKI